MPSLPPEQPVNVLALLRDLAAANLRLTEATLAHLGTLPVPAPSPPTPDPVPPAPAPFPVTPTLQGCAGEIVLTLREVGHRLTGTQLAAEMAKRGRERPENAIKSTACTLVEVGVLTNSQDANPRGYGLPEWS